MGKLTISMVKLPEVKGEIFHRLQLVLDPQDSPTTWPEILGATKIIGKIRKGESYKYLEAGDSSRF